jgi:hypothetical protein
MRSTQITEYVTTQREPTTRSTSRSPRRNTEKTMETTNNTAEESEVIKQLQKMQQMQQTMQNTMVQKIDKVGEGMAALEDKMDKQMEKKKNEVKQYTDEVVKRAQQQTEDKLKTMEEIILRQRTALENTARTTAVLLSNYSAQDTAQTRQTQIDSVLKEIGKTAKQIHHIESKRETQDATQKQLTQFTRVDFKTREEQRQFISKWVSGKNKNKEGKPVFAREEQTRDVRETRRPLVEAMKHLKEHFRAKGERKTIQVNWRSGGLMTVDKKPVGKLGLGVVSWTDIEYQRIVESLNMRDDTH